MLLFFIVLIIIGAYKLFDYYKGIGSAKNNLIKIDTSAITIIRFFPKVTQYKEVVIYRNGKDWSLKSGHNTWTADQTVVRAILGELKELKIDYVVGTDKSKWKDMSVTDNEGVRVKIEENSKLDAHFIVGKMSDSISSKTGKKTNFVKSYIRMINEDKVYAVQGNISALFNQSFNSYRNGTITKVGKDNITRITYIYNGDSSFVLNKKGNEWLIGDLKTDASRVINYLKIISNLQSNDFADGYEKSNRFKPESIIRIEGNNFNSIALNAYRADATIKYVITSTANETGIFRGDKNDLFKSVFIGKKQLLISADVK